MTTSNKIAANFRNALRSTGPRTSEGKRIVAQYPTRHGLNAARSVIPDSKAPRRKRHARGFASVRTTPDSPGTPPAYTILTLLVLPANKLASRTLIHCCQQYPRSRERAG